MTESCGRCRATESGTDQLKMNVIIIIVMISVCSAVWSVPDQIAAPVHLEVAPICRQGRKVEAQTYEEFNEASCQSVCLEAHWQIEIVKLIHEHHRT